MLYLIIPLLFISCSNTDINEPFTSPDEKITVEVNRTNEGGLTYSAAYQETEIIKPSALGIEFMDSTVYAGDIEILHFEKSSTDETWEQPWGEKRLIRNHYNEYKLETVAGGHQLNIYFRLFNDGVAFRYEIPEQENLDSLNIKKEKTEFIFADNYPAWWIPAYMPDRYEYLYKKSPINELEVVHTPLTLELNDSLYVSIHEAALTDYASMVLRQSGTNTLHGELVPWSDGIAVKGSAPVTSSWRTIHITQTPGELLTSSMILNLNEPNKLEDTSWIKPGKYIGIWWGMHIDKYTWGSGERHGATTEITKKYIDFAAEHGFDGVLVEGWNIGWDGDWVNNLDAFNFTQPYPDFDIEALTEYAREKGVGLIGHHETSAGVTNYENQLEDAFQFYEDLGISRVKTGYVGPKLDGKEWHHGQFGVRHYRKVVETAAKHHVMVNAHEPIKDTGIRRTYPNMMTREGARGMEFNAWSADGGNPPEHTTILPFTRLVGGPMDFTPGVFELEIPSKPNNRVNTTLAKQLALYVVIYSPLHMASDLPENYEGEPAFQFIKDVPTDWEDTKVLQSKIGDHITVVRKDRNSEDWYLGSITDENSRTFEIDLSFLEKGVTYKAEMYQDGEEANYQSNPAAIKIASKEVTAEDTLTIDLAPGGGMAVRFERL
ncbi:glycoside hydrolase family 97 protein [Gracilimonas mengyeensis]|nr:glycoside hydrolase family 97 protein [Gracilimonas mengyeensis]